MTKPSPVSVQQDGDVAWVSIDNPPVNATSTAVRAGLMRAVAQVQTARVAILVCAGRSFVAGGDMAEFDAPPAEPHLPDLCQAIEDSATPFVAAMHGNVMGGGLELAMSCAWRIAAPGTRFGLPEVNVGLIPGAGGRQRAPRLLGMALAIDLCCRGRLVGATGMLDAGGIDRIAPGDLRAVARNFADNLPPRPVPVSRRAPVPMTAAMAETAAAALRRKFRGQQSPHENLTALGWASEPFAAGQPKERARHLALRKSDESRALRHAFFAERQVARPAATANARPRETQRLAVVGGGLMGAGIAAACLGAGLEVTVIERDAAAADAARARVGALLAGALKRGKIDQPGHDAQLSRLATAATHDAAAGADLAIEAVFEDVAAKRAVFTALAAVMPADAILATNTSYLDPRDIFAGIAGPSRCIGLHFFSPAHVMKLLEVVHTPDSSAEVLATAFALARRLNKVAVMSGICDGFIGNRMLAAYRGAAEYMLADGALPAQVDAAMRGAGMAMGPFEVQDMAGLQIAWANRKRQAAAGRDPGQRYVTIADQLCEAGRLGQRSGKGWYRYAPGDRTPHRDDVVETLIHDYSRRHGIVRRSFSDADISTRLLAVLANEGALIVDEGIAEDDAAIDMVQLHGYGFPRWRGGPMHHASARGWGDTARAMRDVAADSPGSWRLARRLARHLEQQGNDR